MKMKIAILTGRGDCPGLNGAVKWVTKSALDPGIAANRSVSFEVLGLSRVGRELVEVNPEDRRAVREVYQTFRRRDRSYMGSSRGNKPGNIADKSV